MKTLPVNNYRISQGYNVWAPWFYGASWGFRHKGIDLVGDPEIRAVKGGTIITAGDNGSWGLLVVIDHGNNEQTWYAHNRALRLPPGTRVEKGDVIALMGSTGNSTGVHCHFARKINGRWVDPSPLFVNWTETNTHYMWNFEEGLEIAHHLMLGRGANEQERARWLAQPHTRQTIDLIFDDLRKNATDKGVATDRMNSLNDLSKAIRGKDFSETEIRNLEHPTAYYGKITRGLVKAKLN